MFLKLLDHHHVSITSVFSIGFSESGDFLFSVVDPNKVFLGNLDFGFNVFSMSSGFISYFFILVGNSGQVSNLSSEGFFLRSVNFISSGLSINISLLKISEELKG